MRLNLHLHVVFLDGAYHEDGTELVWNELGHLRARGRSGHRARRRADAPLPPAARASRDRARRRGRRARGSALCLRRLGTRAAPYVVAPQWLRGLSPSSPSALAYDKPLCAALDGFTSHAATRAGAHHAAAREALLRYVLRPPIAKERVEPQQDGLVRLSRRRAFADGTFAVDMDPLSLVCRLAASVPPPRFHTVKYAGVLASASRPRWRASASDRALRSQKSLPLLCQRGADTNQCALRRNGGRWHAGQRGSHAIKARAIARRTVASESAK
ncbi:transposase [Sorangium sp. So ce1389]|uniref:transposase n=1 Tax=Sorangium sp. So ce1389 TaxID=3133336 RepID=UPI003F634F3F